MLPFDNLLGTAAGSWCRMCWRQCQHERNLWNNYIVSHNYLNMHTHNFGAIFYLLYYGYATAVIAQSV
jgi:hypothetical protein